MKSAVVRKVDKTPQFNHNTPQSVSEIKDLDFSVHFIKNPLKPAPQQIP